MAQKKETHHMHFEMTRQEYAQLCGNAKRCGFSKRKYLISLIMREPIRERPSQELRKLLAEINMIGSNINQIARSVNAGIATPEDARNGLFMLQKIYELVSRVTHS